jgi:hypothetical protein
MLILIIIAAVSLVAGIALRSLSRYAFMDLTPSAFLRFADTLLLFAIAVGLYFRWVKKSD